MTMLRSYLIDDTDAADLAAPSQTVTTRDVGERPDRPDDAVRRSRTYDATARSSGPTPTWTASRRPIPKIDAENVDDFAQPVDARSKGERRARSRSPREAGRRAIAVLGLAASESIDRLIAQLFTLFFVFGIGVVIVGGVLTRVLVGSTFSPLRAGGADRRRHRRRRLRPAARLHHPEHRGRPAQPVAQPDAEPHRRRPRRPRPDHRPDAPVRRRREPRAAHAARVRPRLRRAVPDGCAAVAGGRRAGDGPHRAGGDPPRRARDRPARARPARRGARAEAHRRRAAARRPRRRDRRQGRSRRAARSA